MCRVSLPTNPGYMPPYYTPEYTALGYTAPYYTQIYTTLLPHPVPVAEYTPQC